MPLAIFPSVTFPVVKVIADVGHEPAARMMPSVTRPLEQALLPLPGIRLVRSTTSRGSTEISANFDWGTDMQVALQRVQDAIARIAPDLPPDTHVDVAPMNTALFPILGYALTSDTKSEAELWELAEYTLKPELVRIPGVSQVQIQGGRRREFQVHLDLEALAARALAVSDVLAAIKKNNQVLSAGLTESNHELYLALVDGVVSDTAGLSRIAVPVPGGGVPALLGDLGRRPRRRRGLLHPHDGRRPAGRPHQPDPAAVGQHRGDRGRGAAPLRRAPGAPAEGRPLDDLLRPGGVRLPLRQRRARRDPDRRRCSRRLVLLVFLRSVRIAFVAVATIPLTVAIVLLALGVSGPDDQPHDARRHRGRARPDRRRRHRRRREHPAPPRGGLERADDHGPARHPAGRSSARASRRSSSSCPSPS